MIPNQVPVCVVFFVNFVFFVVPVFHDPSVRMFQRDSILTINHEEHEVHEDRTAKTGKIKGDVGECHEVKPKPIL